MMAIRKNYNKPVAFITLIYLYFKVILLAYIFCTPKTAML